MLHKVFCEYWKDDIFPWLAAHLMTSDNWQFVHEAMINNVSDSSQTDCYTQQNADLSDGKLFTSITTSVQNTL